MTLSLLAAGLEPAIYTNPIKILVVVLALFGWAMAAQWVDRDANVVKTQREQWNMIVLGGGAVAFLVLFVAPWSANLFYLGIVFWLLIAGGALFGYVLHRNGRVVPEARVLTAGHLKRAFSRRGGPAGSKSEKGLRVRITDHAGKFVEMPNKAEEAKSFDAVQDFLHDMLFRRADDIDMVAGKENYRVVYRVDGVATELPDGLAAPKGERIFRELKRIAGLNVEEIRRPQVGKIQAALLSQTGDPGQTEVRSSGTTAGERLSLHVQRGPILMKLADLGFHESRLEPLKGLIAKGHGLVLITSPPKHGLTTTQYAIIRSHDAYINNIHALERKKLVELDNITQQIYEGTNTDVNYARMLQTVLRREPDIVMVGECEDRETAKIASRAAAEDRKIYMGMPAKDCFDALNRYINYIEDNELAAKALLGVTSQRLMRLLCTTCREAFEPDEAMLKKLNLPADKIERFYRPPTENKVDKKGRPILCQACQGTGYQGRVGVFELLVITPDVSQLIAEGAPIQKIKAQCRKNRMYYLQEEALLKVISGVTSMNEILRVMGANDQKQTG